MDINLPGISGIEALKLIRLDPATAHIPIVAVSANAIPSDIDGSCRSRQSSDRPIFGRHVKVMFKLKRERRTVC